jgi:RNA polymerase sigma factor (sigma-70 family)
MNEKEWLAQRFEASRARLRAVAYRMLGSLGDADDAVQECWLRVSRADTSGVENLEGWLTTALARVCLNMLRSRKTRREESLAEQPANPVLVNGKGSGPEDETLIAESVGLALLVVLEKLSPAERVAFVLHDVFAVPFEDIAPIVRRSPVATRQLASRARRRVHGAAKASDRAVSKQREAVEGFLAALRAGDVDGILAVLDPDVVRRADRVAVPSGATTELRGATAVVNETLAHRDLARVARPVLVNGSVGIVVAPGGRLRTVIRCTVKQGKIKEMDVIADPARLRRLDLEVLDR